MQSVPNIFIRSGKKARLRLCILFMVGSFAVNANNITVKNSALTGQNTALKTVQISFDLSWENSWRTTTGPKNWDAAWVFVKYRVSKTSGGDGLWRHVRLNSTGHFTPTGGTLKTVTEGAFIYRSANGSGTFTANGVKLLWNYGSHVEKGDDDFIEDDDAIEIRVFGMEMVYVPTGAFYVGDGNTTDAFELTKITTANAAVNGAGYPKGFTTTNSKFPNGYNAFYCMKYEISQQQYVDFLNTQTYSGQCLRTSVNPTNPSGTAAMTTFVRASQPYIYNINRSVIDISQPSIDNSSAIYACNLNDNLEFGESDDGQSIACNYLLYYDWMDILHWSGLRPMTELEFEKSCRGTLEPVKGEFAWGTTAIVGADTIEFAGRIEESAKNHGSNTNMQSLKTGGPMRVGSFASTNTSRTMAGASYYGILDLTGNISETVIHVENDQSFDGVHGTGDGTYSMTWPGASGRTWSRGVIFRGGSFGNNTISVSYRPRPFTWVDEGRWSTVGGRGVRTAPL